MARGLAARRVGDSFVDDKNNQWSLSSIEMFESSVGVGDLNHQIEQFKINSGIDHLTHINNPTKTHKAALYFSFQGDNKEKSYLRYFKQFNNSGLPFSWGGKQLRDATGLRYYTRGTESEHLPIKPSQVISKESKLCPDEVISLIEQKVELPDDFRFGVVDLLDNIKKGDDGYVKNLGKYQSTVEKYIGEYAAPIKMIGNMGYDQVWFPMSGNFPLVDSFVVNDSDSLGISSKGGSRGAAASVRVISDTYREKIGDDHPIRQQAGSVINTLHLLSDNSMIDGPLRAAISLDLINDNDLSLVTHLINSDNIPSEQIPRNVKRLMDNIKPNVDHPNYNIGLHALSGIAREVCTQLNNHPCATEVFKVALKEHNFVQVHAHTQKNGDSLRFSKFDFINPYEFDGKIEFSAQKPYMATTKPKGKITFKVTK